MKKILTLLLIIILFTCTSLLGETKEGQAAEDLYQQAIEKYGWDWSYHAFRESNYWDVEYIDGTHDKTRATTPTEREKVLRGWFDKNQKPEWFKPK